MCYYNGQKVNKLRARSASAQEILDDLSRILPQLQDSRTNEVYISTEAALIRFYHNYFVELHYEAKIYERDAEYKTKLLITPYTDPNTDFRDFIIAIDHLNSRNGGSVKLSHLLNKIDLLENFRSL